MFRDWAPLVLAKGSVGPGGCRHPCRKLEVALHVLAPGSFTSMGAKVSEENESLGTQEAEGRGDDALMHSGGFPRDVCV